MTTIISGILQLILLIFSTWLESNKEKKAKKKEIVDALAEGIKNNDPSAITVALTKLK